MAASQKARNPFLCRHMKLRYLTIESTQALRGNTLRSLLTVIGIVVGIFSVTAMLALGEGLSQNIVGRISSFAQGDISVQGTLAREDLAWINELPYVSAAVGTVSAGEEDAVAGDESFTVSVEIALGDLGGVRAFTIAEGKAFDFSDPAFDEQVVVVSDTFAEAVQKKTGVSLLGESIVLGGQRFSVLGIMETASAGFTRNDGTVYVPYRTALGSLIGSSSFSAIAIKLKNADEYEVAGKHVREGLNASRALAADSDDLFRVSTAQSIIESAKETTATIRLFLGIVGAIALFVGGIGTMNMMLTTVSERTKEIGLRKAIGARRRDILLQVLLESVFLTLIGGAIGILLTALIALGANNLLGSDSPLQVLVSFKVVLIATVVAIFVGVVFGLYPAHRASKLLPAEALRAE